MTGPTDYERIAATYDDSEIRHRIPPCPVLGSLVATGRPVAALEVACGTGLWLAAQARAYAGLPIAWTGLDASPAMLARARARAIGVRFVRADATALPFAGRSFESVTVRFALHHFACKERALEELHRVLAPEGALRMENLVPAECDSWLGRYFPSTRDIDRARFWPPPRTAGALESLGLAVEFEVERSELDEPIESVLAEARRRDFSQLALLDDAEYARGLGRLEEIARRDPEARVPGVLSLLRLTARHRV